MIETEAKVVRLRQSLEVRKGERKELEASIGMGTPTISRLDAKLADLLNKITKRNRKKGKILDDIQNLEKKIEFQSLCNEAHRQFQSRIFEKTIQFNGINNDDANPLSGDASEAASCLSS